MILQIKMLWYLQRYTCRSEGGAWRKNIGMQLPTELPEENVMNKCYNILVQFFSFKTVSLSQKLLSKHPFPYDFN